MADEHSQKNKETATADEYDGRTFTSGDQRRAVVRV